MDVKKKLTVLVCDDSMLVRKKLRNQLLALAEMDVLEAEDGATAVELYRENKPDLVFMDIVMPVKDGIVALEEIRELDPGARVVMASSVGTSQNLRRAIDAGAFDFVQKPSTDARIANIVRRILEEGDHA
ncbi:response regulator [Aminiphilus circumscriptus]|jgi:two-component system chemotaxis response regulator CheY|uniref:response regulator n=1 Tax=Aminiphilus circumscriptus TaxID=290732 RepID=UPI00047859F5|nr:response regulator [Aminiphilus circumscriptus]